MLILSRLHVTYTLQTDKNCQFTAKLKEFDFQVPSSGLKLYVGRFRGDHLRFRLTINRVEFELLHKRTSYRLIYLN